MFNFDLQIIRFIQNIRFSYLDGFFKFLNYFDTDIFYYLLIPIVWIGYSKKLGIKLFFILTLSFFINIFLKDIFQIPRPFYLDESLAVIKVKGFSFPSGAAQTAALLPLIFIENFKRKKTSIILGVIFFILISFSRIYLGVHYLSDVIAGWIVGVFLFFIYLYLFPIIENFLNKKKPIILFWIFQIILIPFIFVPHISNIALSNMSILLGLLLSKKYKISLKDSKTFKSFFDRSIFSIIGVFILIFIYALIHINFTLKIVSYLMGFWISFLCPLLYLKIFNKKFKKAKKN